MSRFGCTRCGRSAKSNQLAIGKNGTPVCLLTCWQAGDGIHVITHRARAGSRHAEFYAKTCRLHRSAYQGGLLFLTVYQER